MIKRKRYSAAEPPIPEDLPVSMVFPFGAPVYLRYLDQMHRQKMLMLVSHGLLGRSTVLGLEWTDVAQEIAAPPCLGSHVQCFSIVNGVLYLANGKLSGVIAGKPIQLHIAVEDPCHGINLRRHMRFAAEGTLALRRPELEPEPQESTPYALDVSIGGFGAVLRDGGWQAGEHVDFTLSFVPVQWPGSQLEFSHLTLAGTAIVRRRLPHLGIGAIRIGCQFDRISDEQSRQLKLLLSTYGAALRFSD